MIKAIQHVLMITTVGMLAGCGVNSSDGTQATAAPALDTAKTQQAVTVLDCQKQAATCVQTAKSFTALGACTTTFGACTAQAATSAAGQSDLLGTCQTKANACLKGALTLSDITACRTVLDACTSDVTSTAAAAVQDALGTAKTAIDKATQIALTTIQDAAGVTGGALDAVSACGTKADSCLTAVVSVSDVSSCQDVFETCLGGAVSLVDKVAGDLPVPTPTQIATDFAACQQQSAACLDGALTVTDISACKGTLQTCVGGATNVVDQTVTDINKLLPPIIQLPTASGAVDCTTAAAQCLLTVGANPVTCATQATKCLAQ